jgi:hypothetical protein
MIKSSESWAYGKEKFRGVERNVSEPTKFFVTSNNKIPHITKLTTKLT